VDVVAITLGDDFLIELGEALSGQATVRPVDTAAAAIEQMWSSRRSQVLAIDTRDLADVRAELQQAVTQAPQAVVVLFVPAGHEAQTSDAVQGLPVQAVLPIPLNRHKTALALASAMADAAARGPVERRPAPETVQEAFDLVLPPPEQPRRKTGLWVGLALAAVAAGGTGYWWLRSPAPAVLQHPGLGSGTLPTASTEDAPVLLPEKLEVPLVAGKLDDLLEKARQTMRAHHYLEPQSDCALLYYRSALAVDPSNAEAADGLQRVGAFALARFEETLAKGRFEDASNALSGVKRALLGDPRLPELEQRLTDRQMARLLADGSFDSASRLLQREADVLTPEQLGKYRTEIVRREDELKLTRLAGQVESAIRDGRLLDPSDDSARAYVLQLMGTAPKSLQTQRAIRDLGAALLRRARDTRGADSDRFLAEAHSFGVTYTDIEGVRRDITQARQKAESERLLGVFRDRLREGKLTDPPQDSAAYYLTQVQAADPGAYAGASRELAAKLLERARASFSQNKGTLAEADLNQARRLGADPKDVAAVQQAEASRVATATAAHASSSPAESSAPASVTPKLLRYSRPEFPQKAMQQGMGGSVTVQFVIDVHGDPRDVRVVEATPPGIFERAAVAAVKRWHYQPTVVNGKPAEVPVQMPIRFPKPE
jgi:protein TonB